MKDRLFKVVLHDQIGMVARKVQRLDSLFEPEHDAAAAPRKLKVAAVLPAYNAAATLERTVADIPRDIVDEIILVDDQSRDNTVEIARKLGLTVFVHDRNKGYGANQKTCYEKAIERGADVAVMVHPDYQYDPRIIPQLIEPIALGKAAAVFGSRMMKGGALEGGMPLWKHNANILLTAFENVMLGTYLTEYHSGFRAYSTGLLQQIRFRENSDGFLFDTEIIVQILAAHAKIEEVPIHTRYFEGASSIRLWPSVLYGLGILKTMMLYFMHSRGWIRVSRFEPTDIR
jgi:glycosyltransferase involved in cell wall biosynthesis